MGNKGQTKANQALLGSFQEFDGLFISALLHKQQGQLQQGIWDQVVVVFNPLFTVGQKKAAYRLCFWAILWARLPDDSWASPKWEDPTHGLMGFSDLNSNLEGSHYLALERLKNHSKAFQSSAPWAPSPWQPMVHVMS